VTADPSKRVRVTSPRTAGTRSRRLTPSTEIDRRTRLGEVYVASLLRVQLRLAAGVLLAVVGSLVALPLLFREVPALSHELVLGVPVSWAVLGFGVYPLLVLGGWAYVRRAERNERDFAAVLEPSRAEPDEEQP
jgi:hypothetical protein